MDEITNLQKVRTIPFFAIRTRTMVVFNKLSVCSGILFFKTDFGCSFRSSGDCCGWTVECSTCICVIMADNLRSSDLDRLLLESGSELSG